MAQQKFFSGLTEGMINRSASERPDRQKTHFFWPNEYAPDVELPKRQETRPSADSRSTVASHKPISGTGGKEDLHQQQQQQQQQQQRQRATAETPATINGRLFGKHDEGVDETDERASAIQPYGNGDDLVVANRGRLLKNTASHIQFYDDVESSFGELERTKAHERRRIEQFLRQQSEEDTGEAARAKRLSTLQSKIEFYDYEEPSPTASDQRIILHRFGGSTRSVQSSSTDRNRTPGGQQQHPDVDTETAFLDDEFEFDDRSSIRSSVCSSSYAPSSGYRRAVHADLPEHKRNSQRHLRSSINFYNGCIIADDSEAPRKPVSVRESATTRVGVGLPNL